MHRSLRFRKRAIRSERHAGKSRRNGVGIAPDQRRLVCEPLEDRCLLSAIVATIASGQASESVQANLALGSYAAVGASAPLALTHLAQITPTITWPSPSNIVYGTALSATQLDATANVPGTFAYTPAAGTVLGAGSDTLSVAFTPTDTTDYTTATQTTAIVVKPATLTITADNQTKAYGSTAFVRTVGGTSAGTSNGQFSAPWNAAIDQSGDVWVVDTGNNRVQEFNSSGQWLRTIGGSGSGNGQLSGPCGISIDSSGNVWVADSGNNRIEEFNSSGTYLMQFGTYGSGNGQTRRPHFRGRRRFGKPLGIRLVE